MDCISILWSEGFEMYFWGFSAKDSEGVSEKVGFQKANPGQINGKLLDFCSFFGWSNNIISGEVQITLDLVWSILASALGWQRL